MDINIERHFNIWHLLQIIGGLFILMAGLNTHGTMMVAPTLLSKILTVFFLLLPQEATLLFT